MLKKIKNNTLRNVLDWSIAICSAILIAFLITTFVGRTASVFGDSMEPTLKHGEVLIIDKLTYKFSKPKYGDVVAFPYKSDNTKHYIKRIIGLPGDSIDFLDNAFYVNGEQLDDLFSNEPIISSGNENFPLIVPNNCYFVLGDNRNGSEDSRYIEVGCVPLSDMDGRIILRVWPINVFSSFY